jgi:hypothetical protein
MPHQRAVNGRVKCLATRFDDEPNAQGRLFSELHEKKEKTNICCGTAKRVLADKLHYKVLWDGDKRQYKSAAAHLSLPIHGGRLRQSQRPWLLCGWF